MSNKARTGLSAEEMGGEDKDGGACRLRSEPCSATVRRRELTSLGAGNTDQAHTATVKMNREKAYEEPGAQLELRTLIRPVFPEHCPGPEDSDDSGRDPCSTGLAL